MELRIPDEVAKVLTEAAEDPDREALEALLLHLIQSGWVSVAWAGERLGLDSIDAVHWYTSHGYPYPDYSEKELEEDFRHAERFRR